MNYKHLEMKFQKKKKKLGEGRQNARDIYNYYGRLKSGEEDRYKEALSKIGQQKELTKKVDELENKLSEKETESQRKDSEIQEKGTQIQELKRRKNRLEADILASERDYRVLRQKRVDRETRLIMFFCIACFIVLCAVTESKEPKMKKYIQTKYYLKQRW